MRRLTLACCVLTFSFAGMCTGEVEKEPDVVVVPVPEDGEEDADENWCCEYKNDAGEKRHALVDGAAECNDEFGGRDGPAASAETCRTSNHPSRHGSPQHAMSAPNTRLRWPSRARQLTQ